MRYLILLVCMVPIFLFGQSTKSALFLGNSYTYVNDLPQVTKDIALSTGDTLLTGSNTPGGYTLEQHSTNTTTLTMIGSGAWDYVVLQEQSQKPSFPIAQVEVEVFPFATLLDSLINAANPCAETVFYMTWGRKNGDAGNCPTWPPVCSYEGMDDLLRERYEIMGEDNDASVSPVGAVWRYIRETNPSIELYSADESHPSPAGTFAAACSFYSLLFSKNPEWTSYDFGLDPATANYIRLAAKTVVYDSLDHWQAERNAPIAAFEAIPIWGNVTTTNLSEHADTWLWDMGDGSSYTDFEPIHNYIENGIFDIQLVASACGVSDTTEQVVLIDLETAIGGTEPFDPNVFYDPAQQIIMLSYPEGLSGNWEWVVTDLNGRVRDKGVLSDRPTYIDLSGFPNGLWVFSFLQDATPIYSFRVPLFH